MADVLYRLREMKTAKHWLSLLEPTYPGGGKKEPVKIAAAKGAWYLHSRGEEG